MKKIVITLIISLSFFIPKITCDVISCEKAVKCHDTKTDTYRLVGHDEKTVAVKGHASKHDAMLEEHCDCA